jgi:hypothetical protein
MIPRSDDGYGSIPYGSDLQPVCRDTGVIGRVRRCDAGVRGKVEKKREKKLKKKKRRNPRSTLCLKITLIRIIAIEVLNTILLLAFRMIKSLLKMMVCLDNFSALCGVP